MGFKVFIFTMLSVAVWAWNERLPTAEMPSAMAFNQKIRPILEDYCFDCHGNGENRGGVALDAFDSGTNFIAGRDVWWRVVKNLRV